MKTNKKEKLTQKTLAARLEEAAETMQRLPATGLKPNGFQSSWPPILQDFWETYGDNKPKLRLGPPEPDAITRMDETLAWLRFLEPEETRLAWAVASRVNRKVIASQFGVHRTTIWREWSAILRKLTAIVHMHQAS